jgi:O-antigen/teichoic acid export membrane protein
MTAEMEVSKNCDCAAERTRQNGGAPRVARNVASMLTTNVAQRGAMFLTYALVARFLGAYQFGQLALAVTLLNSFYKFAIGGVQTCITRDVAQNRELTGSYLTHASAIGALVSVIGLAVIVPLTKLLNFPPDSASVIFLLFAGLPPFCLSKICESIFQGWERMDLIAYVSVPVSVLRVAAIWAVLELGYGIQGAAISLAVSYLALLLLEWLVVVLSMGMPRLTFNVRMVTAIVQSSSAFVAIEATIAFRSCASVVMLSKLCGETSVGLYAAATQLLIPLSLLFDNVALSVFPVMCRTFDDSITNFALVARRMIEGLMIVAVPSIVGLFLLADSVMILVYGKPDYLLSAEVLRIIVWLPLAGALTATMGRVLWASQRETLGLKIVVINTLLEFAVGLVLIVNFGLFGAAASAVIAGTVSLVLHSIPVARLFSGFSLIALMWKPVAASLAMAAFVVWCRDFNLFVTISTSVVLYVFALTGVFVWSAGGFAEFKAKCVHLWST